MLFESRSFKVHRESNSAIEFLNFERFSFCHCHQYLNKYLLSLFCHLCFKLLNMCVCLLTPMEEEVL